MAYLLYSNGQAAGARGFLNQALQSQQEGAADAAVKLAVDRSRSLLAQIDATLGPVAQPAPQATIAQRSSPVPQISATPAATVSPATPPAQPVGQASGAAAGLPSASTAPVASPASAPANAGGLSLPELP